MLAPARPAAACSAGPEAHPPLALAGLVWRAAAGRTVPSLHVRRDRVSVSPGWGVKAVTEGMCC
jgi:hypothetical protein